MLGVSRLLFPYFGRRLFKYLVPLKEHLDPQRLARYEYYSLYPTFFNNNVNQREKTLVTCVSSLQGPVYTKRQRQRLCDKASDTVLIGNN